MLTENKTVTTVTHITVAMGTVTCILRNYSSRPNALGDGDRHCQAIYKFFPKITYLMDDRDESLFELDQSSCVCSCSLNDIDCEA